MTLPKSAFIGVVAASCGRAIVLFSICRISSEGRLSVSFQPRIQYG